LYVAVAVDHPCNKSGKQKYDNGKNYQSDFFHG